MNPRKLTNFATPDVKKHLGTLINSKSSVKDYQSAMFALGESLAKVLPSGHKDDNYLIVSTSEDADFLTSGYISVLEETEIQHKIAVFWNHHYSLPNNESVAPITNSYIQENVDTCNKIVLLKSIISGSCVIRTNLLALLDSLNLERVESIFVAAPVMHKRGPDKLKAEFPENIGSKFEFHTFAIDEKIDDHGNVLDGIGGEVYPHLGLSMQPSLLSEGYIPRLISNLLFR